MASPYVARVAARIKFTNPKLTPLEIIGIIRDSVDKKDHLTFKVKYGGLVNEEKAIELARKTLE